MNKKSLLITSGLVILIIWWVASTVAPATRSSIEKLEPLAIQLNSVLAPEGSDEKCLENGCPKIAYVMGNNALTILSKDGWSLTSDPDAATLIWCRKHRGTRHKRRRQIINQIPSPLPIGDKAFLSRHVRVYDGVMNTTEGWMPETIILTTMDEMRWISSFSKRPEAKGIWIIKKTSQSMGRGIIIVDNLQTWVRTEKYSQIAMEVSTGDRYVCQRYIENPLLLEKRKSELRLYWTIASLEPLIVAVHTEGQVRLNSEEYEKGDYANPRKHLTNAHQQEQHPDFQNMMASGELKWTFKKWRQYLQSTGVANATINNAFTSMKLALVRAVNATKTHLISKANTVGMFEMFGADFILTNDLSVYLTEIQQGPGLSSTDPVKGKVIQSAVSGAASMAYDIMTRRQQKTPIGEIQAPQGYEIIINEAVVPNFYLSRDPP
eukprot:TRINITY_DN6653_c0_g1_i1.p1 TRINITY_DN6653_c0_g1~~TRINITY_DN6653_c0_g1_i1.p1  ORF type:complete len:435 (+),score=70.71 TRINITY_DN6653_c0_g1_i1:45-1349(+)